ncbi:MAG: ATP-binding cassette domain-containing protein [Patescibacteria group bacterium]|nr:ATP-binding cassette domain-containing protein [Patescibacteria group bacterium]
MKVKLDKVTKKFGQIVALDDISFEVNKGDFVFITGKSGAGKSTVIALILAEIKPTQGEVWVNDLLLNKARSGKLLILRRQIGVIYQDFRLLANKTVKENITVALEVAGYKEGDWREKLNQVLETVSLGERSELFPSQLSGGELQRACLARALAINPKMVIADEPTGNLDPETIWQFMGLLNSVNELGVTVIMATHNFDIVNSMGRRVIRLDQGKLISDKKKGKYE